MCKKPHARESEGERENATSNEIDMGCLVLGKTDKIFSFRMQKLAIFHSRPVCTDKTITEHGAQNIRMINNGAIHSVHTSVRRRNDSQTRRTKRTVHLMNRNFYCRQTKRSVIKRARGWLKPAWNGLLHDFHAGRNDRPETFHWWRLSCAVGAGHGSPGAPAVRTSPVFLCGAWLCVRMHEIVEAPRSRECGATSIQINGRLYI